MPLAPIDPNNTQRFWLDYSTCQFPHTLQCRAGSTVTASDAGGIMAAFLASIESQIYLLTVTGFRSAAPGTNITVPEVWPGASTYGDDEGPKYASAQYIDFVGRGPTGRRARAAVFGAINLQVGSDYRVSESESTAVTDGIAALTADGDIFLDVEYEVPVWHRYMNCGVNAYWRNKIR